MAQAKNTMWLPHPRQDPDGAQGMQLSENKKN